MCNGHQGARGRGQGVKKEVGMIGDKTRREKPNTEAVYATVIKASGTASSMNQVAYTTAIKG